MTSPRVTSSLVLRWMKGTLVPGANLNAMVDARRLELRLQLDSSSSEAWGDEPNWLKSSTLMALPRESSSSSSSPSSSYTASQSTSAQNRVLWSNNQWLDEPPSPMVQRYLVDTRRAMKRLYEGGFSETQASTIVRTFTVAARLHTKDSFARHVSKELLDRDVAQLRTASAKARHQVQQTIWELRTEAESVLFNLKSEIDMLKAEMNEGLHETKDDLSYEASVVQDEIRELYEVFDERVNLARRTQVESKARFGALLEKNKWNSLYRIFLTVAFGMGVFFSFSLVMDLIFVLVDAPRKGSKRKPKGSSDKGDKGDKPSDDGKGPPSSETKEIPPLHIPTGGPPVLVASTAPSLSNSVSSGDEMY